MLEAFNLKMSRLRREKVVCAIAHYDDLASQSQIWKSTLPSQDTKLKIGRMSAWGARDMREKQTEKYGRRKRKEPSHTLLFHFLSSHQRIVKQLES
jgi:hypothetical protein